MLLKLHIQQFIIKMNNDDTVPTFVHNLRRMEILIYRSLIK